MSPNKPASDYRLNWLHEHLGSAEEQRVYAQETLKLLVAETILQALDAANINRTVLAERIGKSKGYVSQVINGTRNMTLDTLADLLWASGREIREIRHVPLGEMRVSTEMMDACLDSICNTRVTTQLTVEASGKSFELALPDSANELVAA
jgi:antitoxin component HigA of HigAB toxin-antitoxin module